MDLNIMPPAVMKFTTESDFYFLPSSSWIEYRQKQISITNLSGKAYAEITPGGA